MQNTWNSPEKEKTNKNYKKKEEKKEKNVVVVEITREDVNIVPWSLQENYGYAEYNMKSPEKEKTYCIKKDKNHKRKEKIEKKKVIEGEEEGSRNRLKNTMTMTLHPRVSTNFTAHLV
jgi:hypothetical protein